MEGPVKRKNLYKVVIFFDSNDIDTLSLLSLSLLLLLYLVLVELNKYVAGNWQKHQRAPFLF